MVRRHPELTDRALAKLALADHKTVAAGRAKAEASGEIPRIPPAERVEAGASRGRVGRRARRPIGMRSCRPIGARSGACGSYLR
jgi:hypothetical protein